LGVSLLGVSLLGFSLFEFWLFGFSLFDFSYHFELLLVFSLLGFSLLEFWLFGFSLFDFSFDFELLDFSFGFSLLDFSFRSLVSCITSKPPGLEHALIDRLYCANFGAGFDRVPLGFGLPLVGGSNFFLMALFLPFWLMSVAVI
jgi:hypothetical protein